MTTATASTATTRVATAGMETATASVTPAALGRTVATRNASAVAAGAGPRPRQARRPALRIATAAAAGLAGALALTACSGGGSDSSATPSGTSSAGATATGGSNGSTGSSDALQGSWITTSGGKIVALVVTGKEAGLFETGGAVCSGTAGEEAGMRMIHLSCTDGSKDRVTGMVDSVSKSGMKVTWSGKSGKETYTRAEGGKLPSGLPTAGLGQ